MVGRFSASESTPFDVVPNTIHTLLPCSIPMPALVFKLSTDPENTPWECLDSQDDWDYAINKVRHKKAKYRGDARHVGIKIGFSNTARPVTLELVLIFIPTCSPGKPS